MNKFIFPILLSLLLIITTNTLAQMERQRAETDETMDDAFWAPTLITQPTTEHINEGNLNVTIMHSFGIATTNVDQNLFGLDNVENVRLGLDVGLTDRWSLGIGRSSLLNVVDLRTKIAVIRQHTTGSPPFSLSLKGDVGVVTQENRQSFSDDISTLAAAIISRKINNQWSLQITPLYGRFNQPVTGQQRDVLSIGIGTEIHLSPRFSLMGEFYPVIGDRPEDTYNTFSLGMNIETGGHVFQLFFTSTQWHLEQFILMTNDNRFWAGDFRFGFNVNRIFGL